MKHTITEEEKQEKATNATHNRRVAGYKRSLKTEILEKGVEAFKLKLQFLKEHPTTRLSKEFLTHFETVEICEQALKEHYEAIAKGA